MSALDGTTTPVDPNGGASYKGKRANRLKPCSREIKMLRPICKTCEDAAGGAAYLEGNWMESCEHDCYVSVAEIKTQVPVYEDIMETVIVDVVEDVEEFVRDENDALTGEVRTVQRTVQREEQRPTGEKELTGTKTVSRWVPKPNWVSITDAGGMNKGQGVQKALRKGFIFPQQLRSPAFPEGLKRRCQFRECFNDHDLKQYKNGWFCREVEAKMVKVSDTEEIWEVGQFSKRSDQIQRNILDRMAV